MPANGLPYPVTYGIPPIPHYFSVTPMGETGRYLIRGVGIGDEYDLKIAVHRCTAIELLNSLSVAMAVVPEKRPTPISPTGEPSRGFRALLNLLVEAIEDHSFSGTQLSILRSVIDGALMERSAEIAKADHPDERKTT